VLQFNGLLNVDQTLINDLLKREAEGGPA